MFKLVVLSALVACALAAPAPGHLSEAPVAYNTQVASGVAVPSAVSHQSRTDVHHKGVVATTYSHPVAAIHTAYAAPAVVAGPVVSAYSASLLAAQPAVLPAPGVATYSHESHEVIESHPIDIVHPY